MLVQVALWGMKANYIFIDTTRFNSTIDATVILSVRHLHVILTPGGVIKVPLNRNVYNSTEGECPKTPGQSRIETGISVQFLRKN